MDCPIVKEATTLDSLWGHLRSPVSGWTLGECNAITSRRFSHSELTCVGILETDFGASRNSISGSRGSAEGFADYFRVADNTSRIAGSGGSPSGLVILPLLLPAAAQGLVDLYQGQQLIELGLHKSEFG